MSTSVRSAEPAAIDASPIAPTLAAVQAAASPWALFRRKFARNKLGLASSIVVVCLYIVAVFADFLAYSDPTASFAARALVPPQAVHLRHDGRLSLFVYGLKRFRNPDTFSVDYTADTATRIPLQFMVHGFRYRLFGIFETDLHLIGAVGPPSESSIFLFGTDLVGRDLFSRIVIGMRTTLTIGLVAVAISLTLGVIMGAIAGYYRGLASILIQRLIEILRAIPTVPLWMGLAATIPSGWGITAVYFTITLIIALIGWTELARQLSSRIMALRQEEFVLAAELCGARPRRIIFVHLLPLCVSHIIATATLALPAMIASETALSFLGLGLRPPAISLGVLLSGAQSIQTFSLYPWMTFPVIPIMLIVLAFNFLGDGLRDVADPYA